MKLVSVVGLFAVLILTLASFAGAAPEPKLKTFGTGVVTTGTDGADSATIVIGPGQYGGVSINSKNQISKALDEVDFGFTSSGSR